MAIELLLVRYHRFDVIQVVGHSTHKRDHNWSSLTVWRSGEDHLARPFSKGQTHGVSNHTLARKVIHQRERSLLLKGGSKPQGVGHSPNSLNRKLLISPQQYAKVSYIWPLSRSIGKFIDQVWSQRFTWSFLDRYLPLAFVWIDCLQCRMSFGDGKPKCNKSCSSAKANWEIFIWLNLSHVAYILGLCNGEEGLLKWWIADGLCLFRSIACTPLKPCHTKVQPHEITHTSFCPYFIME